MFYFLHRSNKSTHIHSLFEISIQNPSLVHYFHLLAFSKRYKISTSNNEVSDHISNIQKGKNQTRIEEKRIKETLLSGLDAPLAPFVQAERLFRCVISLFLILCDRHTKAIRYFIYKRGITWLLPSRDINKHSV